MTTEKQGQVPVHEGRNSEKKTASSGADQLISPERLIVVLTLLAHSSGPFSEEAVEIINWLANRELSRRLYPVPA